MRKLLLAAIAALVFASAAHADGRRVYATTTATPDIAISNINSGIAYHKISWTVTGTVPTCSVKLEKSATGTGGWTDLIAGQVCTSNGQTAITNASANYIRINPTTKTGTGTLTVTWNGYVVDPSPPTPVTPGGSSGQVQYNNSSAFGGMDGTSFSGGELTWTSPNAMVTPFTLAGAASQSVTLFTIQNAPTGGCDSMVCIQGEGLGSQLSLFEERIDNENYYNHVMWNSAGNNGFGFWVANDDSLNVSNLVASAPIHLNTDVTVGGVLTINSLTATRTVFAGSKALATGAIASTACNIDTLAATGTLTTDTIDYNFNANVDAVTGYAPVTAGGLRITVYPEADNIKISVCNPTLSSITPGAVTLNLAVRR